MISAGFCCTSEIVLTVTFPNNAASLQVLCASVLLYMPFVVRRRLGLNLRDRSPALSHRLAGGLTHSLPPSAAVRCLENTCRALAGAAAAIDCVDIIRIDNECTEAVIRNGRLAIEIQV